MTFLVGGYLATFLSIDEVSSLRTLIQQKNIATTSFFWFGVIGLSNRLSTVWSRRLSDGNSITYLVRDLRSDSDSLPREVLPSHAFPYVCRVKAEGREGFKKQQFDTITPIGFDTLVQLNDHVTIVLVI